MQLALKSPSIELRVLKCREGEVDGLDESKSDTKMATLVEASWENLPDLCLHVVFAFLDARDVCSAGTVCRRSREYLKHADELVWRPLVERWSWARAASAVKAARSRASSAEKHEIEGAAASSPKAVLLDDKERRLQKEQSGGKNDERALGHWQAKYLEKVLDLTTRWVWVRLRRSRGVSRL